MTTFLRLQAAPVDQKAATLRNAVCMLADGRHDYGLAAVYESSPDSFGDLPSSPFAYWVGERIRGLFPQLRCFESDGRLALGGLKTLSDERFVRAWWELPAPRAGWQPLAKGGAFSPHYADLHLCVGWRSGGREISSYGYQRRPREGFGATNRGIEAYFRSGVTWPRRTGGLSFRVMPSGSIFGDKGPAAFLDDDDPFGLLAMAAVMNSSTFGYLIAAQLARTELAQSLRGWVGTAHARAGHSGTMTGIDWRGSNGRRGR